MGARTPPTSMHTGVSDDLSLQNQATENDIGFQASRFVAH